MNIRCLFGHKIERNGNELSCSVCGKTRVIQEDEPEASQKTPENEHNTQKQEVVPDGGYDDDLGEPFETVDQDHIKDDAIIIGDDDSSEGQDEDERENTEDESGDVELNEDGSLDDDAILEPDSSGNSNSQDGEFSKSSFDGDYPASNNRISSNSTSTNEKTLPERQINESDSRPLECTRCSNEVDGQRTLNSGDICPSCSIGFLEEI